jgi:hypothetical protein
LLNPGGAKTGESVLIDGHLPGQELIDGQSVAATGFLERKQASPDGGYDLRLAPDHPALRSRRRQVGDGQRTSIRSYDIFRPMTIWFGHIQNSRITLTLSLANIEALV